MGNFVKLMEFLYFYYYLALPRPTLGHYRGDSLTHPMLITEFYNFGPKFTRSTRKGVGSLCPAESLVGGGGGGGEGGLV